MAECGAAVSLSVSQPQWKCPAAGGSRAAWRLDAAVVFGINHLVRGFTRRPAAMMQLPAEGAWPRPLCSPLAPGNPPPSLRPPLRAKSLFLSQSSIITKYKWLSTFIHVNKCLFIFPRGSGGGGDYLRGVEIARRITAATYVKFFSCYEIL